ncbi:hypothetical protein J3P88_16480 [Pseudomonas sp. Z3-6]|uniref:hypothetical protein n=1 Tax=Pseudomonas sp. Z3-6 TaxID=2817411 RepID=UPI003DA9595B
MDQPRLPNDGRIDVVLNNAGTRLNGKFNDQVIDRIVPLVALSADPVCKRNVPRMAGAGEEVVDRFVTAG